MRVRVENGMLFTNEFGGGEGGGGERRERGEGGEGRGGEGEVGGEGGAGGKGKKRKGGGGGEGVFEKMKFEVKYSATVVTVGENVVVQVSAVIAIFVIVVVVGLVECFCSSK